jgi:hypothetical protein
MQIGSGFSGECVRDGKLLRCDDTEIDPRVDIQTCRALGIRSMLAAPLRIGENTIGLLEVFSQRAHGFTDGDTAVLQRFAEMILTAFNRTLREYSPVPEPPVSDPQFPSLPGNVLFVDSPRDKSEKNAPVSDDNPGGVRLPRTHLLLLVAAAATIALALGFSLAPWIQDQLHSRHIGEPKVLASSTRPTEATESSSTLGSDSANLAQLRQLAAHGDASAENALGLLYIAGDEKQNVKPDETLAAQWFIKAAEHGNVPAQSKLGSLYWSDAAFKKTTTEPISGQCSPARTATTPAASSPPSLPPASHPPSEPQSNKKPNNGSSAANRQTTLTNSRATLVLPFAPL